MSGDLIQFRCPVCSLGYKWLTTREEGQPAAPEPLPENASDHERRKHHLAELAAQPGTYLTKQLPEEGEIANGWEITPFKNMRGRLYVEFGNTQPTQEGIRDFASKFGLLGGDISSLIPVRDVNETTSALGVGERLEKWIEEITQISTAIEIWSKARERDLKALSKWIHWDQDSVRIMSEEGGFVRWHDVIASKDIRPHIFEDLKRGDLVEPALLAVQLIVNKHLWEARRVSSKLVWNSDTRSLELRFMPHALIGAIWFDFALAIDAKTDYRKCPQCGTAFSVHAKGQRRKFCSDRCRVAHHRAQNQEGEST